MHPNYMKKIKLRDRHHCLFIGSFSVLVLQLG
jgi:hypothetical protein